jgi:hypothetical protein
MVANTEVFAGLPQHAGRGISQGHAPAFRHPIPVLQPQIGRATAQLEYVTLRWEVESIKDPPVPAISIGAESIVKPNSSVQVGAITVLLCQEWTTH